ncbi:CpsD/CapB family tyrosine-protein kinase [uncultured Mitsuokella sp.]|uniref:CpsD/CapB family tyrosine-protein kinase n=1 Tax=uncultured Mitsuokella sp. TaxID=453120 RepID=UPI00266BB78A|nr:CpsD/CapB family tyrosine-protein kinase [uncultured Mitsuokella sp.]
MAEISFITDRDKLSPISEAYRAIRTNLQFAAAGDKKVKTIVFTSALPSEGKSTTDTNLAIVMGQDNKRVLLVDCELRRPVMHRRFGLPNRGLTNCFADDLKLADVIQHDIYPNLDVVTSGPIPPNPAELLGSPKMQELLQGVEDDYDYILLDLPPILVVTDAAIVGSKADGVILVVGSGDISPDEARQAKALLEKGNVNILGVVLNKVPQRHQGGYYYYYYYDENHEKHKKQKS